MHFIDNHTSEASSFCCLVVSGALVERPLNVATGVGGQTIFNCSSNETDVIMWLHTTDCNPASGIPLTVDNCNIASNYTSHYSTEKPGGFVCNLIVFDAGLSLGGCYACSDGLGTERIFQAMLIIVGTQLHKIGCV